MAGPSPEYRAFVEAGIGICMSVFMADGKFSAEERNSWMALQHGHPLFRDVPPDAFNQMLRRVELNLTSGDWRERLTKWAGDVPQKFRLPLFELAAELAVADKQLEGKEPEVVRRLGRAFGIPDEEADRIFMSKIAGGPRGPTAAAPASNATWTPKGPE